MKISPDKRYVAFTMDTEGHEIYSGYVKDLDTGEIIKVGLPALIVLKSMG